MVDCMSRPKTVAKKVKAPYGPLLRTIPLLAQDYLGLFWMELQLTFQHALTDCHLQLLSFFATAGVNHHID